MFPYFGFLGRYLIRQASEKHIDRWSEGPACMKEVYILLLISHPFVSTKGRQLEIFGELAGV